MSLPIALALFVLTALAESGMIERRRRAGSFVARQPPHLEQVALEIPDIEVAVTDRGHQYGFQLLERLPARGVEAFI